MKARLDWLCARAMIGVFVIFLLFWELPRNKWRFCRLNRKLRKQANRITTAKSNCRLRLKILLYGLKQTTERLKLWKS